MNAAPPKVGRRVWAGAGPLGWVGAVASLWMASTLWPQTAAGAMVGFTLAFGCLVSVVLLAGFGAAVAPLGRRSMVLGCVLGGAVAGFGAWLDNDLGALVGGAGLLWVCAHIGAGLGRGVQRAAHLWPLAIVALSADIWSVTSPEGLTNQVVVGAEEGAWILGVLLLQLPVPGVGISPLLGVGDVLFTALLMGAVAQLELSARRLTIGLGLGYVACLITLFIVAQPVPALPFLAVFGIAALGARARSTWQNMGLAVGFVALLFGVRALF